MNFKKEINNFFSISLLRIFQLFNYILGKMNQDGIYQRFQDRGRFHKRIHYCDLKTDYSALDYKNIVSAFVLLGIGGVIGVAILLAERIMSRNSQELSRREKLGMDNTEIFSRKILY